MREHSAEELIASSVVKGARSFCVIKIKKGVYMTRRQWMWLWIWLLLFFIIFCVWNKLQTLTNNFKTPTTTLTTATSTPEDANQKVAQMIAKVEDAKDVNLKIIKEDNSVKISGIFSSKEDIDRLKSAYQKTFDSVEEDLIIIDKDAHNSKIIEVISSMSEDFSKFKNGYLEYSNKTFTIDGIVDDETVKKSIGDKALMAGDLLVDNQVSINQQTKEIEKPKEPTLATMQEKLNNLLKVKNVEFVFAKAKLTDNGEKTIDEVYEVLTKYQNIKVEIGGHTDSVGTRKNNKNLSQNRADSIKRYLISKRINSTRLSAVGYGESKPLVNNNSSKNRQINRRVEFKILGE